MTGRDLLLPESLRADVVRALYAEANQLGWAALGPQDKTAAFARWVDDRRIGQRLAAYMTPEQARLWIKDGPMKEYARAMRGLGRFAEFGREGGTGPRDIVVQAVGVGARIRGDVRTKPPQCFAIDSGGRAAYVTWGDSNGLKHLVWAALIASIEHGVPGHVVILEPPGVVTPSVVKTHQRAVADRCGLTMHYLREVLGTMRSGQEGP